jgi:hypothetical protein
MTKPRATIPEHVLEMKNMNRRVMQNETCETIARAIWEGKAIMGTDGCDDDNEENNNRAPDLQAIACSNQSLRSFQLVHGGHCDQSNWFIGWEQSQ